MAGRAGLALAGLHLQERVGGDDHGAAGAGGLHEEIGPPVAEHRRPHPVAGGRRQAVQQAADVFQVAGRRGAALGDQQQLLRRLRGDAGGPRRTR